MLFSMNRLIFAVFYGTLLASAVIAKLSPQLATMFSLKNVAVTNIAPSWPGSDSPALLATTFAAFGKTPVAYVPELKSLAQTETQAEVVDFSDDLVWTNYIGESQVIQ